MMRYKQMFLNSVRRVKIIIQYFMIICILSYCFVGCRTLTPEQKLEKQAYRDHIREKQRQRKSEKKYYLKQAMLFPTTFNISKIEAEDVWGRAQSFIVEYSIREIEIISDYVIKTKNPKEDPLITKANNPFYDPGYGYTVTKTPVGDNFKIKVECCKYIGISASEKENSHILAYYMKTGKIPPKGLVTK